VLGGLRRHRLPVIRHESENITIAPECSVCYQILHRIQKACLGFTSSRPSQMFESLIDGESIFHCCLHYPLLVAGFGVHFGRIQMFGSYCRGRLVPFEVVQESFVGRDAVYPVSSTNMTIASFRDRLWRCLTGSYALSMLLPWGD
jgi:hypothetical protein